MKRIILAVLAFAGSCDGGSVPNRNNPPIVVIDTDRAGITFGHGIDVVDTPACFLSGAFGPEQNTPTQTPNFTLAPWTGVETTDTRVLDASFYGSTGCGRDAATGKWAFLTNSCNDATCTSEAPAGRTAQLLWGLSGNRRPFASPDGKLTVSVDMNVTMRSAPADVIQFGLVWIALRDTRGTEEDRTDDIRIWYGVSLWDTRDAATARAMPPVISDWVGGGGTPNFNVLGYLDGPNSRAATQVKGVNSWTDSGGSFYFDVTYWHLLQAVGQINTLIQSDPALYGQFPLYSTNLANYEFRAAAVDFEINERTPANGQDVIAFTVDNFKITQTGGTGA